MRVCLTSVRTRLQPGEARCDSEYALHLMTTEAFKRLIDDLMEQTTPDTKREDVEALLKAFIVVEPTVCSLSPSTC